MVERLAVNQWVVGSSPTSGANKKSPGGRFFGRIKRWVLCR
jgi:hypothetical protein